MNVPIPSLQTIVAYASIVFAVLTQALSGIHLDPTASAVLGAFGILLHPQTSITSPARSATVQPPTPPAPPTP